MTMENKASEVNEEHICSIDKQFQIEYKSHKKHIFILRSFQIGLGVFTMTVGVASVTVLKETAGLFLFVAILCGFFMMEAALANIFILAEHSGENFHGWQEGIRKAGREGALCVLASWACGIIFTIAMVSLNIIVLFLFNDTLVKVFSYLQLICGIFLLIIIAISVWYGTTFTNVRVKKPLCV